MRPEVGLGEVSAELAKCVEQFVRDHLQVIPVMLLLYSSSTGSNMVAVGAIMKCCRGKYFIGGLLVFNYSEIARLTGG